MKKKVTIKEKFNKRVIPLMLLMVVPLIMFYQVIEYDTVFTNPYLITNKNYADIFAYGKSIALYIVGALCILFYFLYTKKEDFRIKKDRLKFYIPAAIYGLFIFVSTIAAIYPRVAVFGVYERFEGAIILFVYLILVVYAIEIIKNETDIRQIAYAFLTMTAIISIIGILQSLAFDIFKTEFFQSLIGIPKTSEVSNIFTNMAYSTLYNPNNVGQFSALALPIVAGIFMAFKKMKSKIFAGVVLILVLWLAYASGSSNALAGLIIAGIVFVILLTANILPSKKLGMIAVGSIVLLLITIGLLFGGKIYTRIINTSFIQNELRSLKPVEGDIYFYDIDYAPDNIRLVTNQGVFNLGYRKTGISFFDADMKFIDFEQKGKNIYFLEEPYKSSFMLQINTKNTLTILSKRAYGYSRLEIVFDEEQFLGIIGTGGTIVRDIMPNQMPLKYRGLETVASRRGYLWFVTLSRLDEVIFWGSGPDNFLYFFEQNDLTGKLNMLHKASILVDKPHNWYLQIASQTGVLSLLAFLALTGIYIVQSFIVLGIRKKKTFYELLGSGILAGILAYMVSSFFVDSTVGVTPLFFFFLGVGIICNEAIRKKRIKDRFINSSKKKIKS